MAALLSVFIATTIFGVGVTVLDLFGVIGDRGDETDGADDSTDEADGGDEGDADQVDDGEESDGADGRPAVLGHDERRRRNPILGILGALRTLVYFCLGFGPVGWFAVATGETALASLAWSVPVGAAVMVGGRLVRRVVRRELSSDVKDSDLLMETGKVTVTIEPDRLGRVRVHLAGTYADRYARSVKGSPTLRPGTPIRVVDLTEDCIIVEEERPALPGAGE